MILYELNQLPQMEIPLDAYDVDWWLQTHRRAHPLRPENIECMMKKFLIIKPLIWLHLFERYIETVMYTFIVGVTTTLVSSSLISPW